MVADNKTERSERAEVSAVPLYRQVMDDLKGEIARGVYASGSRIPSEIELAKSYGVGRVTVRRAIEELSRAGYLNRQQGRGTFVLRSKLRKPGIPQKGDVQGFTEGCAAQRCNWPGWHGVAHGGCGDARGRGVFWRGARQ